MPISKLSTGVRLDIVAGQHILIFIGVFLIHATRHFRNVIFSILFLSLDNLQDTVLVQDLDTVLSIQAEKGT